MNIELERLTPDDREILESMLFPVFQSAVAQHKSVTRQQIKTEIANIFPWQHVSEVLRDIEEREYIHRISTRGGGIYITGENYAQWADTMKPIEYLEDIHTPKTGWNVYSGELTITETQAESLIRLVRALAAQEVDAETSRQVNAILNGESSASAAILALLAIR